MESVLQTSRFVSTLFPANVRDRIMNDANDDLRGKSFLMGGKDNEETGFGVYRTRPIADYFPHTTVMFADISGRLLASPSKSSSSLKPFTVRSMKSPIVVASSK
jgi:hypothetical protein